MYQEIVHTKLHLHNKKTHTLDTTKSLEKINTIEVKNMFESKDTERARFDKMQ